MVRPGAAFVRLAQQRCVPSIARRGDLQYLADRLDPEGVAMLVDEIPQDFSRRSSSAWAKNALASFRISLARRNSLTSRSSSFTRCASSLVTPSRTPVSTSTRLTYSSSVCGTQPIFGAIDSTAAHNDGYSPRCSCTILTARSRTSGENFFDLFMASSSQELKPPQNPGRFSTYRQLLAASCLTSSGCARASCGGIRQEPVADIRRSPNRPFVASADTPCSATTCIWPHCRS